MDRYSQMLLDSAEIIHKILKNHKKMELSDIKISIAAANTLAQTAKTAIQTEIVKHKLMSTQGNTAQVLYKLGVNDEIICVEG
jgi:hypothetical protein